MIRRRWIAGRITLIFRIGTKVLHQIGDLENIIEKLVTHRPNIKQCHANTVIVRCLCERRIIGRATVGIKEVIADFPGYYRVA